MPILQTETPEKANTEAIVKDLDMTNELCEAVPVCIASYQQRMTNLYNKHVKRCAFQAGDLVLRRVFENIADLLADKFQPNWEGSYMIVRVEAAGLYALNELNGTLVPIVAPQNPGCLVDNPSTHGMPLSHIKRPIHE